MEIKLKDVNDDLTITRGGVSIRVFEALSSLLPPPVEGDVQIFDDPECTRYATGMKNAGDKVYARVNVPWGFGENWQAGSSSEDYINCFGPDEVDSEAPYGIGIWSGWSSDNYFAGPFTAGQVVECNLNVETSVDVTNFTKVFTKPTN